MEYNSEDKIFRVKTTESFGRLLLDLLYLRSEDTRILKIQRFVGRSVLEAYIDVQIGLCDKGIFDEHVRDIKDNDIGSYIATRAEDYARNNSIELSFNDDYLDGLCAIAENEVDDLPKLIKEREFALVITNLVDNNSNANRYDEIELQMIDDEIEQAKSAYEVLELINKNKGQKL